MVVDHGHGDLTHCTLFPVLDSVSVAPRKVSVSCGCFVEESPRRACTAGDFSWKNTPAAEAPAPEFFFDPDGEIAPE